jgi:hypothetical protein
VLRLYRFRGAPWRGVFQGPIFVKSKSILSSQLRNATAESQTEGGDFGELTTCRVLIQRLTFLAVSPTYAEAIVRLQPQNKDRYPWSVSFLLPSPSPAES